MMATAEYMREWRARNKDKVAAHNLSYRLKNQEAIAAKGRAWYEGNRELTISRMRQWRNDNPDRTRENARNNDRVRRERQAGALSGGPEDHEYAAILIGDPCSYCDRQADTVDHIIAVHSGGDGTWENLTGACGRCNSSKATKSLLEYLR